MALHFTSGVTDYGAADHQVDFFAKLEDFLVNTVGWTCVAGAGTTNQRYSSAGESGLLTMLFLHIWVVGPNIKGEVSDDAVPTHETTEGGLLIIFPASQARYWFTADLDVVIITVPYLNYDRCLYLGMLDPVGTPPNETYSIVASDAYMANCSILRYHTGVWNVDLPNYSRDEFDNIHTSRLNGEYAPYALYAHRRQDCAGQYKYIGKTAIQLGLEPHDVVTSTFAGATAEWTVFCGPTSWWMIQTGGAAPGDLVDGAHFAYTTGGAGTVGALMTALQLHLQGIGWSSLGAPGLWTTDWLWSSAGEDGTSSIFVHFGWEDDVTDWFRIRCIDDAVGTHWSTYSTFQCNSPGWFPVTYHIAADRDCVVITIETAAHGAQYFLWAGKCVSVLPGITDDDYLMVVAGNHPLAESGALRGQQGTWTVPSGAYGAVSMGNPSSPNNFDGTTYVLWPFLSAHLIGGAGARRNTSGVMKYIMNANGPALALADTITVGAEVYTVFQGLTTWAMRTV